MVAAARKAAAATIDKAVADGNLTKTAGDSAEGAPRGGAGRRLRHVRRLAREGGPGGRQRGARRRDRGG